LSVAPRSPGGAASASVAMTAPPEASPPPSMPTAAPYAVSPRHQIPRTSSGHNVEAATANASPTDVATLMSSTDTASTTGTSTATTVAARNAVTGGSRRLSTSWLRTPATETARPDDVDRNAANAPAVSSAPSNSPSVPPITRPGSSSTTASERPSP